MKQQHKLSRRHANEVLAKGTIGAVAGLTISLLVEGGLRYTEAKPGDPVVRSLNENRLHFMATMGVMLGTGAGMLIGNHDAKKAEETADLNREVRTLENEAEPTPKP